MQAMCGIDSPVAGVVLEDRVHASGARLKTSAYGRVGVEFEIAVRLGKDLVAQRRWPTLADVAAAVDAVCPAIEIIDDRRADYRTLDALSLIADNAWNGGIVLGEFSATFPDLRRPRGSSDRRQGRRSRFGRAMCSVIRFIRSRGWQRISPRKARGCAPATSS